MVTEEFLLIILTPAMPTGAASTLIKLTTDRVDNSLNPRMFLLERLYRDSLALGFDPLGGLLGERQQCLAVFVIDLTAESFLVADLSLETIDKGGECIERLNAFACNLIFGHEVLSFPNHTVNIIFQKATLLIGDGDRF